MENNKYYLKLAELSIKEDKKYRFNFVTSLLFIAISLIIYILLFRNLFTTSEDKEYFTIYFVVVSVLSLAYQPAMYVCYNTMNDINDGKMVLDVIKPINYIFSKIIYYLSKAVIVFLVNYFLIIVFLIFYGYKLKLINLFLFPICAILGFLSLFYIQLIIGFLAYKFRNVLRLRDVVITLLFMFGGRVIPVEYLIYPLNIWSAYSPFANVYDLPTRVILNSYNIQDIFIEIIYLVIFHLLASYLYKRAKSELELS